VALSDDNLVIFESDNVFLTVIPNEYGTEDTGGRYELVKFEIDKNELRKFFNGF
jgi:hypothetical protein